MPHFARPALKVAAKNNRPASDAGAVIKRDPRVKRGGPFTTKRRPDGRRLLIYSVVQNVMRPHHILSGSDSDRRSGECAVLENVFSQ